MILLGGKRERERDDEYSLVFCSRGENDIQFLSKLSHVDHASSTYFVIYSADAGTDGGGGAGGFAA